MELNHGLGNNCDVSNKHVPDLLEFELVRMGSLICGSAGSSCTRNTNTNITSNRLLKSGTLQLFLCHGTRIEVASVVYDWVGLATAGL